MPNSAGQLYKVFVEPAVREWLNKRGLVPGDLNGGRNMLDVLEDDAFQRQLHQAMHGAAEDDLSGHEKLLRGFLHLAGKPITTETNKHIHTLAQNISAISPYAQALAPDLWDDLHGSRGSVASLTSAIAQANKHRMSPIESHQVAQNVFKNLYSEGDPFKTRGFSSREAGQILGDLMRRGKISPYGNHDEISEQLTRYMRPLAAIRDSLQSQGPVTIDDVLHAAPSILTPELEQHGLDQAEQLLRRGSILSQQGGLYSAAARSTGLPPGVDLQHMEQMDQRLRQQATGSPIGNMIAATHRLSQEIGFEPNSVASNAYQKMLAGETPFSHPRQWLDAMSRSGIDPGMAREVLSQTARNRQFVTPDLIDTIRRSQNQIDIQPRMLRYTHGITNPALLRGAQEQGAHELGYGTYDQLQALHGEPAQRTRAVGQYANGMASVASGMSGFATQQPLTRMVDAVQNATPETTTRDLIHAGLNVVPRDKIPGGMPGPLKAGSDAKITPIIKQTRQRSEEIEICPHCQEEIGEKSMYCDPNGYEYHRPCQDKGPIRFSESGRRLHALLAGGKEASGDELAFKAWKARGLSNEAADFRAGVSLELPDDIPKGEICPHCGHRLEYNSTDEKCNHCGKRYPPEKLAGYNVDGIASGDGHAFFEFCVQHNEEDRDSGELDQLSDGELRRLKRGWQKLSDKEKLKYHRGCKLASERPPTIAVDLDGTLAGMYDVFDPDLIEPPRKGARETVKAWKDKGYKIIIFTVRGNTERIREWLEEHDIPFDHINKNPDNPADSSGKPIADCYVDDRAVNADQSWKQIAQEVEALIGS